MTGRAHAKKPLRDIADNLPEGLDGRMAEIAAIYCHTGGRLSSSSGKPEDAVCAALHVGSLAVRG